MPLIPWTLPAAKRAKAWPHALTKAGTFNETDHPRADDGRFGSGGGSAKPKEPDKPAKQTPEEAADDYKANGTKAKAFKAWFGDWENDPDNASKITDDRGRPQKVYHGSPDKLDAFTDIGWFSFTPDNHHAAEFGENIHEVYLNIKNPLDLRELGAGAEEEGEEDERVNPRDVEKLLAQHGIKVKLGSSWGFTTEILNRDRKEIRKQAIAAGFDGLVVLDYKEFEAEEIVSFGGSEITAFDAAQIKAVDNAGTFDPKDPKIAKHFLPWTKSTWNESQHDRDDHGRFGSGSSGPADKPTAAKPSADTDEAHGNAWKAASGTATAFADSIGAIVDRIDAGDEDLDAMHEAASEASGKAKADLEETLNDIGSDIIANVNSEFGNEEGLDDFNETLDGFTQEFAEMVDQRAALIEGITQAMENEEDDDAFREQVDAMAEELQVWVDEFQERLSQATEEFKDAAHGARPEKRLRRWVCKSEFNETDHPRADDGRFGAGAGHAKPSKPKEKPANGPTKNRKPEPEPKSEKAQRAKDFAKRVDGEIQRYAEEHNEPKFAKAMGGVSFPDSEPVDVVVPKEKGGGVVGHGLELKTMVDNGNNKITMKRSAMERKAEWERKNKAPMHTVVFDDHEVFNANGPGQHDESKRKIFYRRGYGSFRVGTMHQVKDLAELKTLMNTDEAKLPPAAQRPKGQKMGKLA